MNNSKILTPLIITLWHREIASADGQINKYE
jgi:hypothetical protein